MAIVYLTTEETIEFDEGLAKFLIDEELYWYTTCQDNLQRWFYSPGKRLAWIKKPDNGTYVGGPMMTTKHCSLDDVYVATEERHNKMCWKITELSDDGGRARVTRCDSNGVVEFGGVVIMHMDMVNEFVCTPRRKEDS